MVKGLLCEFMVVSGSGMLCSACSVCAVWLWQYQIGAIAVGGQWWLPAIW